MSKNRGVELAPNGGSRQAWSCSWRCGGGRSWKVLYSLRHRVLTRVGMCVLSRKGRA